MCVSPLFLSHVLEIRTDRGNKGPVQGPTAGEWPSEDLNSGTLTQNLVLFALHPSANMARVGGGENCPVI